LSELTLRRTKLHHLDSLSEDDLTTCRHLPPHLAPPLRRYLESRFVSSFYLETECYSSFHRWWESSVGDQSTFAWGRY